MRPVQRVMAKTLGWLLALLVPAQACFALSCPCRQHLSEVVEAEHTACEYGCADEHGCELPGNPCGSTETAEETWTQPADKSLAVSGCSGLFPCQCPQDCDCHTRHTSRIEASRGLWLDEDPNFAPTLAPHEPLAENQARVSTTPSLSLSFWHSGHNQSALTLCAWFCRFAI